MCIPFIEILAPIRGQAVVDLPRVVVIGNQSAGISRFVFTIRFIISLSASLQARAALLKPYLECVAVILGARFRIANKIFTDKRSKGFRYLHTMSYGVPT